MAERQLLAADAQVNCMHTISAGIIPGMDTALCCVLGQPQSSPSRSRGVLIMADMLMAMGYDEALAKAAIAQCGGDVQVDAT